VLLFRLGVAASIDILFYRGVVLCAVAFVIMSRCSLMSATHRPPAPSRLRLRAGFLSVGLNLSVLVIAPVTVDRSISVFILGYMAAARGPGFH